MRERIQQLAAAYRAATEFDPRLPVWLALSLVVPLAVGVVVAAVTGGWALWAPLGLGLGLAAALLVFGRRLQAAQFDAIEGMPGAAAAVLNQMRGQWFVTPAVGVNKQQEMVHRVVGRCGVVLVSETGANQRVKALLQRERRKLARVVGDTPVHVVMVGDGEGDTVELGGLQVALARFSNELDKTEVPKLHRRLVPLDRGNVPMPKGHIPRGGRPR